MTYKPYSDIHVVELGDRISVSACGRLLADLGATVYVVEPRRPGDRIKGKWADRISAMAGKQSILADASDPDDVQSVARLIQSSDVVLRSSDLDEDDLPQAWIHAQTTCPVVCDVTAYGSTGPLASEYGEEQGLQNLTGIVHTTGLPTGDPLPVGVPFVEMSSGLYAACAVAVALNVWSNSGHGQHIEVALYDVAINALSTFVAAHFAGNKPGRLGNGHGMAVPWNAYPTADGWILICTTNDAQWKRLVPLIGRTARAPEYAELKSRLAYRAEIDKLVRNWTKANTLATLESQLNGAGIPCGRIVSVDRLAEEPNLKLRAMVTEVRDPVTGRTARVPSAIFRYLGEPPPAVSIPEPDSGRPALAALTRHRRPVMPARAVAQPPRQALKGLRVIEIGQLTTAPLAARHLAALGADVIKVEPPEGESARAWEPRRNGVSHFFVLSNGEKRTISLDLRVDADREYLMNLLKDADVLLENLKPGALARMGFSFEALQRLNPHLVYCAISGFGIHSSYPGRAAVDTVIQAMSGIMDSTRSGDTPVKAGISAADIAGGQSGLLLVLAALAQREKTGKGCAIDISMQDVGAWMTQHRWNGANLPRGTSAPVSTIADACNHPQTRERELIQIRYDAEGQGWEVLGSPMRLSLTPTTTGTVIGGTSRQALRWRSMPDTDKPVHAPEPASPPNTL